MVGCRRRLWLRRPISVSLLALVARTGPSSTFRRSFAGNVRKACRSNADFTSRLSKERPRGDEAHPFTGRLARSARGAHARPFPGGVYESPDHGIDRGSVACRYRPRPRGLQPGAGWFTFHPRHHRVVVNERFQRDARVYDLPRRAEGLRGGASSGMLLVPAPDPRSNPPRRIAQCSVSWGLLAGRRNSA